MTSVLIYDEHCGWSPSLNASKGTGGTEMHLVQIASWLADRSGEYRVAAMCHDGKGQFERGVWYRESRGAEVRARFDVILTVRKSQIPWHTDSARVLTIVTDDPRPCPDDFAHLLGRSTLVCVSEWQASLYRALGHDCIVIPAMIDDAIYDREFGRVPVPNTFSCVSAWNKGTQALLDAWPEVRPPGSLLFVGSPYGEPEDAAARCREGMAVWLGRLKPSQIVDELAESCGHVRVCTIGETFGATDAIAEALGVTPYVYCPGDVGALQETLSHRVFRSRDDWATSLSGGPPPVAQPARDFRVSTIMPQWATLLEGRP